MAEQQRESTPDAVAGVLGYLNFSTGKSDPRFQKQLDALYSALQVSLQRPWEALGLQLREGLRRRQADGASAFANIEQADAVLAVVFDGVLPAYRAHHADLLGHQSESELFQVGFLIRALEAVLTLGPPWDERERHVRDALGRLNDFVGQRPVAILETRPRGEPYDHERVRPIPLYLQGAGVLSGRYRELVTRTLAILRATERALLADASFDPDLLDELAFDPRAYDHGQPIDKRPNYRFGEWDPHHIDNQGRYRRFVVRQLTLDALLQRPLQERGSLSVEEALEEAAVVLGGTILMAAGVSGWGPGAHDSSATLATLVPRIARYREAYYADALSKVTGAHGQRLRHEAEQLRQPFGGARQHFNQYLARQRAFQLQQQHLALVLAELGYPDASRRQAVRIPATSVRLLSEMHILLTTARLEIERGELERAAEQLPDAEALLQRGIACGALADPWNILGFGGLFPLSAAREDSVRDTRIDQLLEVVEQIFSVYGQLLSEAAATGASALGERLSEEMKRLAAWWDRFATFEVGDVRRVHGGDATTSAVNVAATLANWRAQGQQPADLAFWRLHLDQLNSPRAFALVVDALLSKRDHRAALALLVSWLNQSEQVPLEDDEHSFHALALRWLLSATTGDGQSGAPTDLVRRFFDYLEANAEEFWEVPHLDLVGTGAETSQDADENPYEAAYEGVTYRDSTADDVEGDVLDDGPTEDFDLQDEGPRLETRLRFLATLARLWQLAARVVAPGDDAAILAVWLERARHNAVGLGKLLDALHQHAIPTPSEAFDSVVEFDRRRLVKEQLVGVTIATALETVMAQATLEGLSGAGTGTRPPLVQGEWWPDFLGLQQALVHGDTGRARTLVTRFLEHVRDQPLLYTPLAHGGDPRPILQASIHQTVLRVLAVNLPRLGLVRATFELLCTAQLMEQTQQLAGPRVTEFDRLFRLALGAVTETVVLAAQRDPDVSDAKLIDALEIIVQPFLAVWIEHSKTLRVAALETVADPGAWERLSEFIRHYGHDLFHVKFLALGNLRGVLHGGIGAYLHALEDNPDPLHAVKLLDDLDVRMPRTEAERWLEIILQTLIENYEEYKDYNTTAPQAAYGENLHLLFEFLRLKASYERHAWQLAPLVLVHEILARERPQAAILWQEQLAEVTQELADEHLHELALLEQTHGIRLRTVADRLEERFVKTLALDRLCALVEPAMEQARSGASQSTLYRLEEALVEFTDTPTGVGLDVPHWLVRLEREVSRVQARHNHPEAPEFLAPRLVQRLEELQEQLQDWEEGNAKPR